MASTETQHTALAARTIVLLATIGVLLAQLLMLWRYPSSIPTLDRVGYLRHQYCRMDFAAP